MHMLTKSRDVPFCRMGDNDPHNVTLDKYEFYMTTMRGRNTFPYQPASNNLYVGSTTKVEISQCRTDVDREETDDGDKYQIRLFDVGGNQIAENSKVLRKYDESVEARTQDGKHMTSVTRKGAIRDGTEKGGDMWFQYFGDRTNTMWVRDGIGADMRYSKTEGFTGNEGGFCSVPVLEGEKKRQRVSCYHSCEK